MTGRRASLLVLAAATAGLIVAASASAQTPISADSYAHSVPKGQATTDTLPLSLADAIRRGLDQNLGVLLSQTRIDSAASRRTRELSDLLPHVSGAVRDSEQVVNLAAFGFTGFPGIPQVIGPFGVFDARLYASAPIFDASAHAELREARESERAETAAYRNVRELVVLAVGNAYLEAVADRARVESVQAEVTTAEALAKLAEDQHNAGIVAGIDVLRQQVQLESTRARLITAQNVFEKQKLKLARAIGLPAGQQFELTDRPKYAAATPVPLDAAVAEAYKSRDDLKSAEARVSAAEASHKAATAGYLPSLHVDGDYGVLGSSVSSAERTYSIAAGVRVPIFDGNATRARVQQSDADLRARRAELDDLRAGIRADVEAALLDLQAADASVRVADSARTLARQQLTQAEDRFRAGVTNTIELADAQQADAIATERYIESVYAHTVAKATLARAMGRIEEEFLKLAGGL